MPDTLIYITISALGLIIGSFLTVCIFRIPHGRVKGPGDFGNPDADDDTVEVKPEDKLSIFSPSRSFCPVCKEQLRWFHNIPFFSWLILGGKCAHCKTRIPFMYPLVELLSSIAAVASYYVYPHAPATACVVYIFTATLIVLSFIDIEYFILPNVITFPGMAIGLALTALNQFFNIFQAPVAPDLLSSFYGFLAGAGTLFFISEVYFRLRKKVGLGFGDVKLLAMTGLIFGPQVAITTIFLGSLLGSVLGALLLLFGGHGFSKPLPFGPYLALGTILCLFIDPAVFFQIASNLFS